MTQDRNLSIEQLIDHIVEAEIASAEALECQDTKAQNRWADRRHIAIRELLSRGVPGRVALEGLLHHELPLVRLAAATNVFEWDPDGAVSVLEELLAWAYAQKDSKRPGLRPLTAVVVMSDAEFLLSQHYGIRLRDVVPRVLGIEEDPRPWT